MTDNLIDLPDFKIDQSEIPFVRVKSIRFQNFKVFEDYFFDFFDRSFACFYGPNGCGKTTVLDTIQLIFSRFDEYKADRLKAHLGKSVRHIDGKMDGIYGNDDFLITAIIESSVGGYEIQINKSGFIKDHPEKIKSFLYRLFYYARFDQELHQFQLNRQKWTVFKEIIESVTGFEITEKKSLFDTSDDPVQADLLRQYVLGFWVSKPNEKISHTECSAGERKIIKSFSTLLNMEYTPQIICIDNVAMHVESGRHIQLIESVKKCFPDSQIFATTHSYQISRNFGNKDQLYDLRLVANPSQEIWRLQLVDEISDYISKLRSNQFSLPLNSNYMIIEGEQLIESCRDGLNKQDIFNQAENFMKRVISLTIKDMYNNSEKKETLKKVLESIGS